MNESQAFVALRLFVQTDLYDVYVAGRRMSHRCVAAVTMGLAAICDEGGPA